MSALHRIVVAIAALLVVAAAAEAQFGGRKDDLVLYMMTAKGSGDFQTVGRSVTNSPQSVAEFKIIPLDSVPVVDADPFPLRRQVLYERDDELFQVGTDTETTVGLHRIFVAPTKVFVIEGLNNPLGPLLGNVTNYIAFPKDIDLVADVALESLRVLTWVPKRWPFIVLTDQRGPLGPPDISGFEYLFQLPGAVNLPNLTPWTNMWRVYPNQGWPSGVFIKIMEKDPVAGNTARLVRIGPGRRTPTFRIPGHTHLFVLQGGAQVTLPGGTTVALKKYDYAYVPAGFALSIANPFRYDGPVMPKSLASY